MRDDASDGALWSSADAYERYVGRWSRPVADEFLRWVDAAPGGRWLDVGCGTGALSQRILASQEPRSLMGVDLSAAFIAAGARRGDRRVGLAVGTAEALPAAQSCFDVVVSGLVLNFVPDPRRAVAEIARVLREDGIGAVYVWDYTGEMQMMRHFWDAAIALDPAAREHDEGARFPICRPDALEALWREAGLDSTETRAIDVPTVFADFEDYWQPFLAGRAPAPAYAMALSAGAREDLREEIRRRLPVENDGSIRLRARAWAVKGRLRPRS